MTKFRIGPEASLGSNARIIPGSRVAATTGHAIPELERELIARAASTLFASHSSR